VTAPPRPPPQPIDRSWLFFFLALAFYALAFFTKSDIAYTDDTYVAVYSVSLGEDCETDIRACKMVANPAIGMRVDTVRAEVTSFAAYDGVRIGVYRNCAIWDARNWDCEEGRVGMRYGVLTRNDFAGSKDLYYISKIGWKMAKLHILPLDSVRRAPPPVRQPAKA
jgi:hypothetical protein